MSTTKTQFGEFSVDVRTFGDKELAAAFRSLGKEEAPRALRRAATSTSRKLLFALKMVAPVARRGGRSTSKDPGRLRRNLRLRTHFTKKTVRSGIAVNVVGDADNPRNAYYYDFVERGHRVRSGSKWGSDQHTYIRKTNRKSGGYSGPTAFVKGRWFIRDTWNTYKEWALKNMLESITTTIEKSAARQRRAAAKK